MNFASISFFQKITAFLSIAVILCAVSACNLFDISVPDFIDKNINTADGEGYRFISETNGTAGGFHLIKPYQATELDILLRNPKRFDVEPILDFLNGPNNWTTDNPLYNHGVYIAAENTGDYNRIRVIIGVNGGFPAPGTELPRMRLKLKNRESGRVYANPYELPLMRCAEYGEDPLTVHIAAVVPIITAHNSDPNTFQVYWYPGSGGGEIENVTMKFDGTEEKTANPWEPGTSGLGTAQSPYCVSVTLDSPVPADTQLTVTVFYADGRWASAAENPGSVNFPVLPIYVSGDAGAGSYGITRESPAPLADVFTYVLERYSDINIFVSGTIDNAESHDVNNGKEIVIEPLAGGDAVIRKGIYQQYLFDVTAGGKLTIQGNGGDTLTLKGMSSNNAALITVSGDLISGAGELIMKDKAFITENKNSLGSIGGGVYIDGGAFTMEGGEISGNSVSGNGGGVYVGNSGKFTMNSGIIGTTDRTVNDSDNKGNTAGSGGGVYIADGKFIMNGGTIAQNKADNTSGPSAGGGVFVGIDGTFEMNGGIIGGENSSSDSNGNWALGDGGGVLTDGIFTMGSGSRISNNTADGSGGGVYLSNGEFTLENGSRISNNTTIIGNGGGVYVSGGNFRQNGGTVTENTANGSPNEIAP